MKPTSDDRQKIHLFFKSSGLDNMEGPDSVIGHLKKIS